MDKSFSLIELLVSLIIISLLLAALSPIFTKKINADDVTIDNFKSYNTQRNVTQQDCDSLNAVYVPKSANVEKPLCVTKYNVGDFGNEDWTDVQKCVAGNDCIIEDGNNENITEENLKPVCWQGTTAEGCNAKFGGYSGCTRTVCNFTGAKKMCSNYNSKGISGWRLPTMKELTSFTNSTYSSNTLGANGLMLCGGKKSSAFAPVCSYFVDKCKVTIENTCHPYNIWSSSTDTTATKVSSRHLNNGWRGHLTSLNFAFSTRCVLDSIDYNSNEINNSTSLQEPTSQQDCDKYNALFIPKEYNGEGGKNLCVAKYNVGDINGPNIASGVHIINSQETCEGKYCCFQGKTAEPCSENTNADSTYSGCYRTVCTFYAANLSCNNYAPDGIKGLWRLPSKKEIAGWNENLDKLALNKGASGLQLCNYGTSDMGLNLCHIVQNLCKTSVGESCSAYGLFASPETDGTYSAFALNLYLSAGTTNHSVFYSYEPTVLGASSARCVTDKVYK